MAGSDWPTLRLKFIHSVAGGCLHLALSGEDVWLESLSRPSQLSAHCTVVAATNSQHFISLTQ